MYSRLSSVWKDFVMSVIGVVKKQKTTNNKTQTKAKLENP